MGISNWFKFGKNKTKTVKIQKIKEQSVNFKSMAAGSPSVAAAALSKMVDQKQSTPKILMVQDGEHSQQLTDYALKMAKKLDFQLIALDVTDSPLQYSGERKNREIERFYEQAQNAAKAFELKAKSYGLTFVHKMEIGDQEQAISKLNKEDAGIRYVLTKPEQDEARADNTRVQIPVFDLNCSRL
jgi:hypothetical protein